MMIKDEIIKKIEDYYNLGKYESGLELAIKFCDNNEKSSEIFFLISKIYYKQKKIKESLSYMRKAVINDKKNIFYIHKLAELYNLLNIKKRPLVLLESAININIHNDETLYLMGNILLEKKKLSQACTCFSESLKKNKYNFKSLNNFIAILIIWKKYNEAILLLNDYIKNKIENEYIYFNLGNLNHKLKNYDLACFFYEKALFLNSRNQIYYNNLANVYLDKGIIEKANFYRLKSLKLDENYEEALWNNYLDNYYLDDIEKCKIILNKIINISNNYNLVFKSLVSMKVLIFLKNNYNTNDGLILSKEVVIDNDLNNENELKNYIIYNNLLKYFLSFSKLQNINKINKLYIIGESHCLSLHNQYIQIKNDLYYCESKLIYGIKLWHLSQNNFNKFKFLFLRKLSSLPKNSTILISIGEIDCRLNEGIFSAHKKQGISINILIDKTIKYYFQFLIENNILSNHKIIIQGIPPLSEERISNDQENIILQGIVYEFNKTLLKYCLINSLPFLDLYSYIKSQKNLKYESYIDDFHLTSSTYKGALLHSLKHTD